MAKKIFKEERFPYCMQIQNSEQKILVEGGIISEYRIVKVFILGEPYWFLEYSLKEKTSIFPSIVYKVNLEKKQLRKTWDIYYDPKNTIMLLA